MHAFALDRRQDRIARSFPRTAKFALHIFVKDCPFTMSKWFRSEPMEYISLIVNQDAAHGTLADLGRLGVVQFTDVSIDCRWYPIGWKCFLMAF
jgi:hypothetical protein